MNTRKEIVDKIYDILWEDQTSDVFNKETKVLPKIKEIIDDICRCKVTNLNTWMDIHWGLLDFLYMEKTIYVPEPKRLMWDIYEDSDKIVLNNADWLPVEWWYVEINGNIISYTSISNDTLEWVVWINGIHHWWSSIVNFVYVFPEDLCKVSDFFDIKYKKMLDSVDFRDRDPTRTKRCYSVKPYNDRKCAIFFNCEGSILITWSKLLPEMEEDDDECGFPSDYWLKIIPYLVTGYLLVDTSESQKGKELLQIWYNSLEDMYQFYATPVKKFRKKIGVTPMKFNRMTDDAYLPYVK